MASTRKGTVKMDYLKTLAYRATVLCILDVPRGEPMGIKRLEEPRALGKLKLTEVRLSVSNSVRIPSL